MDPLLTSTTENIDSFSDITLPVEGRFEERLMNVQDVLAFRPGAVIPMHRAAGETLRVYVDNVLLASAEVIVIEDHLALRITEFERLDA
jgi:flagellar motor switch protein FliN